MLKALTLAIGLLLCSCGGTTKDITFTLVGKPIITSQRNVDPIGDNVEKSYRLKVQLLNSKGEWEVFTVDCSKDTHTKVIVGNEYKGSFRSHWRQGGDIGKGDTFKIWNLTLLKIYNLEQ